MGVGKFTFLDGLDDGRPILAPVPPRNTERAGGLEHHADHSWVQWRPLLQQTAPRSPRAP
jgi:hypothetical protein